MVKDAQLHEQEDKKLKETIEKRNKLDGMIVQIEKTLKENKEKLPIAEVNTVESALEEAKKVLKEKENDGDALEKTTNDLMQASHKIAEILYKETQDSATGQQPNDNQDRPNPDATQKQGPIDTDAAEG